MTTSTATGQVSHTPRRRLQGRLRRIGGWLFGADDARARRHGWQVAPRAGGLGRVYRDPRFDLLAACPSCNGTGGAADQRLCPGCAGTGRINRDQPSDPARR